MMHHGIRKAAGEHAKILNEMMEEKEYYSSKGGIDNWVKKKKM